MFMMDHPNAFPYTVKNATLYLRALCIPDGTLKNAFLLPFKELFSWRQTFHLILRYFGLQRSLFRPICRGDKHHIMDWLNKEAHVMHTCFHNSSLSHLHHQISVGVRPDHVTSQLAVSCDLGICL